MVAADVVADCLAGHGGVWGGGCGWRRWLVVAVWGSGRGRRRTPTRPDHAKPAARSNTLITPYHHTITTTPLPPHQQPHQPPHQQPPPWRTARPRRRCRTPTLTTSTAPPSTRSRTRRSRRRRPTSDRRRRRRLDRRETGLPGRAGLGCIGDPPFFSLAAAACARAGRARPRPRPVRASSARVRAGGVPLRRSLCPLFSLLSTDSAASASFVLFFLTQGDPWFL